MNFIERYSVFWADIVNRKDKISRNDYWNTILIVFISFILVSKVSSLICSFLSVFLLVFDSYSSIVYMIPYILTLAYFVSCIVPFITMSLRRLNDVGLSHWHILSVFVFPLFVYYMCSDSKPDNLSNN